MTKLLSENLTFSEVGHLPIIKDFAKKLLMVTDHYCISK